VRGQWTRRQAKGREVKTRQEGKGVQNSMDRAKNSTVQYSTVQYSTVQYSTVQYRIVQYSMVQQSVTHY
jgi:hypothetical protein